jgi:hypothetical protein
MINLIINHRSTHERTLLSLLLHPPNRCRRSTEQNSQTFTQPITMRVLAENPNLEFNR